MIERLARFRHSIESRLINRFPQSVFFGLIFTIPIFIVCSSVGAVMAIAAPTNQAPQSAAALLPEQYKEEYLKNLRVVQTECNRSSPMSGSCYVDQPATSTAAVARMFFLTREANLNECHRAAIPARSPEGYDYLKCSGYAGPSLFMIMAWTLLAIVGFIDFFVVFISMTKNRSLLPKWNPNLWLTPYAFVSAATFTVPLTLSLGLYAWRVGGHQFALMSLMQSKALAVGTIACSLIAAVIVVDLRTYRPSRDYIVGVLGFLLLCSSVLGFVLALLSLAKSPGLLLLLLCVGLSISSVLILRWFFRSPTAFAAARSATRFLSRLVVLAFAPLVATVILVFGVMGVLPDELAGAPFAIAVLSLLSSGVLERRIARMK